MSYKKLFGRENQSISYCIQIRDLRVGIQNTLSTGNLEKTIDLSKRWIKKGVGFYFDRILAFYNNNKNKKYSKMKGNQQMKEMLTGIGGAKKKGARHLTQVNLLT